MNQKIKKKWVKALRSGRYRQEQGVLSACWGPGEANCCLGVLCRVARMRDPEWRDFTLLADFDAGVDLRERAGLSIYTEERLVELNDAGNSFSEIADYIERHL